MNATVTLSFCSNFCSTIIGISLNNFSFIWKAWTEKSNVLSSLIDYVYLQVIIPMAMLHLQQSIINKIESNLLILHLLDWHVPTTLQFYLSKDVQLLNYQNVII